MKMPIVINRIYHDFCQIAATTVITSSVEEWIYRRYGRLNTYWNQDYSFIISYPKYCVVSDAMDKTAAAIYTESALLAVSIILGEQVVETPRINLIVEKLGYDNFMDVFAQRLQGLEKSGFSVDYSSDERLKVVTLIMGRMNQGEPVYAIQKYLAHDKHIYTISVDEIGPQQMDILSGMTGELKQVINSFTFVKNQKNL
ncbi:MAG TPA: hypothetical protein VN426_06350 [Syntrophomonadaceae bacterium]|nr:hypothetical protein [Syntrophomonadaceae bacterium]